MKSFEEILKEGKDKVVNFKNSPKGWREKINLLMETLHTLNEMYGTTKEHQVKIKTINCEECKGASFVITIRDLENRERLIKFHRGKWLATEIGTYYCEKCKKGKVVK